MTYKSSKHAYKIIPIDPNTHIYCKKYLHVCIFDIFDICKSYIHEYK